MPVDNINRMTYHEIEEELYECEAEYWVWVESLEPKEQIEPVAYLYE